ncbi:hypothetical protein WAI453_007455 [Rhynchosporium graminicola]
MQSRFDIIQRKLETFLLKMDRKEWLKLLKWISNIPYGDHHRTVTGEQTGGTCEWLLRHKDYVNWREADSSSALWIPGTGKTFLNSIGSEKTFNSTDLKGWHSFTVTGPKRRVNSRSKFSRPFFASYRSPLTIATKPRFRSRLKRHMTNCQDLLVQLIRLNARKTLVLDALDEVENTDGLLLVDALDYLVEKKKPKVLKIVISGRPDGNITWKLRSRECVFITASDNQNDISKFVKEFFLECRHLGRLSTPLRGLIISTLQEKSQGMFQWAYLKISQLLELDLPRDIEDRSGKLPKGLKETYDEIIKRMPKQHQVLAYRAIQWVMCAQHPLYTEILLPAVSQDEGSGSLMPLRGLNEAILLEYCHNLLIIDPVRKVWVTSHLPVNEYFENHVQSNAQANSLVLSIFLLVMQNTIDYDREVNWGTSI